MAGFMGKIKKSNETALRKKKFDEGTLRYRLFRQAQETLKSGINLKEVVKRWIYFWVFKMSIYHKTLDFKITIHIISPLLATFLHRLCSIHFYLRRKAHPNEWYHLSCFNIVSFIWAIQLEFLTSTFCVAYWTGSNVLWRCSFDNLPP